ncbi:transposase [Allopontixanthobacter sediminis]|uniref:Transposase n=1 Tax=Allopontixanthobacter sediminis TaxID=1689985 RepID=A0A845B4U9_9SPHN|nr:transposase [Allopontixanthobacter sediminis]
MRVFWQCHTWKERAAKRHRYSEEQISNASKQAQTETPMAEAQWRMGIPEQTFYRWNKRYEGPGVGEVRH